MTNVTKKELQHQVRMIHPEVVGISLRMDAIIKVAKENKLTINWRTGKVFDTLIPKDFSTNKKTGLSAVKETIKDFNKKQK